MIKIDINKAKEITKNRIRNERKVVFVELDQETMKHQSNKTKLAEIEKEKQRLRDITKLINKISNLQELAQFTLKEQNANSNNG